MEPITISLLALGTVFANEGIKFLWKQAETIVNRYNERKYKEIDEKKEKEKLAKVETTDKPKFLELPQTLTIDFDRAKEKAAKLAILSEALAPYVTGGKQPDASDEDLKRTMDTVQQLIEYVYNHQFQIDEEVRRNIVEATGGGSVEMEENVQRAKESGENVIRADGTGSSVKIGKSEQEIG